MNSLDLAVLAGLVLAGIGGWRLGLIRRVTGWVGLLAGVALVSRLLPDLISTPDRAGPADLLKSLGIVLVGGMVGQAVGHFVGGRVRRLITIPSLGTADSVVGMVVGVVGVLLVVWMIVPAMVQIPGWPAETARSSVVASRLTRVLGEPPDLLGGVSEALGVEGLPEALDSVRDLNIEPVAPADSTVPAEVLADVRRSVVKLSGPACQRQQSGSGFVIAPGTVATNAHVVAGTERLTISNDDGLDVDGVVTYLDLRNDIALVSAPRLDRPPLDLVESPAGSGGAILGYPGGGPLVVQPYTIAAATSARSRDIYGRDEFLRDILILGSRIGPGDSGGPLVADDGRVAGIAFGIAPDDDQTAYAVPSSLLREVAGRSATAAISSGPCRVG